MRHAVLALPLLLLAGCLDAPQDSRDGAPGGGQADASLAAPYSLWGAFTENASQADLAEVDALARAEGWDAAILESFPMQLSATGRGEEACERLRAALATKAYVARVGECQRAQASDEPDAPTSSGVTQAEDSLWRFRGSFTQDFTDEDVRAVCRAAGHGDDCAMMKSLPPQYAFTYASREACEAARGRVLAVPHVAGVTECAAREGGA